MASGQPRTGHREADELAGMILQKGCSARVWPNGTALGGRVRISPVVEVPAGGLAPRRAPLDPGNRSVGFEL